MKALERQEATQNDAEEITPLVRTGSAPASALDPENRNEDAVKGRN